MRRKFSEWVDASKILHFMVLLGFGLDSDAIHSPNEHYGVFNYLKGIETIPYFFENYSKNYNRN
mgnify:CR=1 FL=1